MTDAENYKVVERVDKLLKEHGTKKKALKYLEDDLEHNERIWSSFSSDSLGHGIKCTKLMIDELNNRK